MSCALGCIDKNFGSILMRKSDDLFYGIKGAGAIGNMSNGDEFSTGGKKLTERIHIKLCTVVNENVFECGPSFFAQNLPRNHIGVMFHFRNKNLIFGSEERSIG